MDDDPNAVCESKAEKNDSRGNFQKQLEQLIDLLIKCESVVLEEHVVNPGPTKRNLKKTGADKRSRNVRGSGPSLWEDDDVVRDETIINFSGSSTKKQAKTELAWFDEAGAEPMAVSTAGDPGSIVDDQQAAGIAAMVQANAAAAAAVATSVEPRTNDASTALKKLNNSASSRSQAGTSDGYPGDPGTDNDSDEEVMVMVNGASILLHDVTEAHKKLMSPDELVLYEKELEINSMLL